MYLGNALVAAIIPMFNLPIGRLSKCPVA